MFQKDRNELPEVRQECLDVSNLPTTFLLGLNSGDDKESDLEKLLPGSHGG